MPRAENGKPDFHRLIARNWTQEPDESSVNHVDGDSREPGGCWRTPEGVLVYFQHVPVPIALGPELLEHYRWDAHLAARAVGGGLVEINAVPDRGVFAVSRLPDHRRESGLIYTGLGLIPAKGGHLALTIIAHEGARTGRRENMVYRNLYGDTPFAQNAERWFDESNDFPYAVPPSSYKGRRTTRCQSDDAYYDEEFPEHPLSLTRAVLTRVRAKIGAAGAFAVNEPSRLAEPEHEFFLELPPGYQALDYGDLRRGRIFRRWTFDNRLDIIGICPQPDFPDSGRSVAGARRLLKMNAEGAPAKRKPVIQRATLEGREGILCEVPGHDGERELLTLAMYLPWGESALEISVGWEADDRERMEQRLRGVLRSLKRMVD